MSFSAATLHAVLDTSVPAEASGFVVALSGGPDSAALLGMLVGVAKNFRNLPLRAVHVDHGLQAAAKEFRQACRRLCDHLSIPLTLVAVEVERDPSSSVEAAARDARYTALAAQLRPGECLLTAHHREDQAETLLLQALRGAGVRGLSAMPICRVLGVGWHVRPLLDVSHRDLLEAGEYLQAFTLIDPMNEELRFDRVYLRTVIWPLLERRWPGAATALARCASHMGEAQQLLDAAASGEVARLRDGDELSIPGLRALPPLRRINAVRRWLNQAALEAPPTVRLAEGLRQIFAAEADHQPAMVWGQHALRRYRKRLFVTAAEPPRLQEPRNWTGAVGASVELGPGLGNLTWVAQPGGIAAQRLPAQLSVRRRQGGETLRPAASAKTQSVQHLCQSLGVLPWMRDALPLVFAGDELIAIADLWLDARWCAAAGVPGLGIAWNDAPLMG